LHDEGAMLSETIGLTLFPGVMAFAAASDFLTMRIANRVSLLLIAGFALLAALGGMGGAELLSHLGAAADPAAGEANERCRQHRSAGAKM
jgi:Flp pilus assembly protein protease CpaA